MRISDWSSDVCSSDLLLQQNTVAVDDFQITDRPFPVLSVQHARRMGGRPHGFVLHLSLGAENTKIRQAVLDFLERDQYCLAIVRDIFLVSGAGLIQARLSLASDRTSTRLNSSH